MLGWESLVAVLLVVRVARRSKLDGIPMKGGRGDDCKFFVVGLWLFVAGEGGSGYGGNGLCVLFFCDG